MRGRCGRGRRTLKHCMPPNCPNGVHPRAHHRETLSPKLPRCVVLPQHAIRIGRPRPSEFGKLRFKTLPSLPQADLEDAKLMQTWPQEGKTQPQVTIVTCLASLVIILLGILAPRRHHFIRNIGQSCCVLLHQSPGWRSRAHDEMSCFPCHLTKQAQSTE